MRFETTTGGSLLTTLVLFPFAGYVATRLIIKIHATDPEGKHSNRNHETKSVQPGLIVWGFSTRRRPAAELQQNPAPGRLVECARQASEEAAGDAMSIKQIPSLLYSSICVSIL